MTRQRYDGHATEFELWLKHNPKLDSSLGYICTNVDCLWCNYNTGEWMLIEEKRYYAKVEFPQSDLFEKLINSIKDESKKFKGFHVIQFEKTSPDDGKIYLDYAREISKDELISFLKFEMDANLT